MELKSPITFFMLHKKILDSAWKKGFSLTEILVAVGIMSIITGIGTFSYLKYLDKAHLSRLEQSTLSFWKAAEACLLTKPNFGYCNTFKKLRWSCTDCKGPVIPVNDIEKKHILVEMTSGDYSVCARLKNFVDAGPGGPKKVVIKHTKGQKKFCMYEVRLRVIKQTDGTIPDPNNSVMVHFFRFPFETCKTGSDCKNSGDKCQHNDAYGTLDVFNRCAEAGAVL